MVNFIMAIPSKFYPNYEVRLRFINLWNPILHRYILALHIEIAPHAPFREQYQIFQQVNSEHRHGERGIDVDNVGTRGIVLADKRFGRFISKELMAIGWILLQAVIDPSLGMKRCLSRVGETVWA